MARPHGRPSSSEHSQSWLCLTWWTAVFLVLKKMKLRAKFCTANYLCLCSAVSPKHQWPPYAGSRARHPGWGPPDALIELRCTPNLFRDDDCLSWGLWSLCSCPKAGHTGKCSPPAITGIISPLNPENRAVTPALHQLPQQRTLWKDNASC